MLGLRVFYVGDWNVMIHLNLDNENYLTVVMNRKETDGWLIYGEGTILLRKGSPGFKVDVRKEPDWTISLHLAT